MKEKLILNKKVNEIIQKIQEKNYVSPINLTGLDLNTQKKILKIIKDNKYLIRKRFETPTNIYKYLDQRPYGDNYSFFLKKITNKNITKILKYIKTTNDRKKVMQLLILTKKINKDNIKIIEKKYKSIKNLTEYKLLQANDKNEIIKIKNKINEENYYKNYYTTQKMTTLLNYYILTLNKKIAPEITSYITIPLNLLIN